MLLPIRKIKLESGGGVSGETNNIIGHIFFAHGISLYLRLSEGGGGVF